MVSSVQFPDMNVLSAMLVKLSLLLALSFLAGRLEASTRVGFVEEHHPNSIDRFTGGDDASVGFLLFTRDDIHNPDEVTVDDEGHLFGGKLNVSRPTKVIIHGWLDTWKAVYAQTMIASFLPEFDFNVIVVNWPEAGNPLYYPSREKVPAVGKIVGRLLDRLNTENGLNSSSVHMIGHSLGAHVAAVAGYSSKIKIGKITALDPALPLFSVGGADTLSQKAADFVEVVHTCGHFLGMVEEIGHVNFYPNGGGPFQPGCTLNLSCSHKRSFKFYTEAIGNATAFLATECSDWETYNSGACAQNQKVFMSDSTPKSARGKFFLKTAASAPYGLGPLS